MKDQKKTLEKVKYYDKISRKDISKKIAKDRIVSGLKSTICVYMTYEEFEQALASQQSEINQYEKAIQIRDEQLSIEFKKNDKFRKQLAKKDREQIFINHIQKHLQKGEKVICKICGITVEQIYEESKGEGK